MATNEILPFATDDTGTNLLTQAEYSTDAQRDIGHQPGIARAKLANKAMRQVSLLAAGVAEFIADYQANNVTDGLTPQQIADYLLAAITANIPVIPDASTTTKGIIETATAAEAQTFASTLLALTPSTLNQALKGSNQSLGTDGYQKLPGGLILQWGNAAPVDETWREYTFPLAFPNEFLAMQATDVGTPPDESYGFVAYSSESTRTTFGLVSNRSITNARWLAIGY